MPARKQVADASQTCADAPLVLAAHHQCAPHDSRHASCPPALHLPTSSACAHSKPAGCRRITSTVHVLPMQPPHDPSHRFVQLGGVHGYHVHGAACVAHTAHANLLTPFHLRAPTRNERSEHPATPTQHTQTASGHCCGDKQCAPTRQSAKHKLSNPTKAAHM